MAGGLLMSQRHGRLRKVLPCYHRMPGDSHHRDRINWDRQTFSFQAACMLLAGVCAGAAGLGRSVISAVAAIWPQVISSRLPS